MNTRSGWTVNIGATVSQIAQYQGYGFIVRPSINPGPFTSQVINSVSRFVVPADFPFVVKVWGDNWAQEILVQSGDAFFFNQPFTHLQIDLANSLGSFLNRVDPSDGQFEFNFIYSFDLFVFGQDERVEATYLTQQLPGYLLYYSGPPSAAGNQTPQYFNVADFAAGPPAGNDPNTTATALGIPSSTFGVDARGHKSGTIFLLSVTDAPQAAGTVELWSYTPWLGGLWRLPDPKWQWTPQAVAAHITQKIADVSIPQDVTKLYVVCNGITNVGGNQHKNLFPFLELR